VERVKLNGAAADIRSVERGRYSFWTVEYLYTYGSPAPGSLAAGFLTYLNAGPSQDLLRAASYNPVTVTCAGCSTVNR
jgi:hypothetical protein